MGGVSGGWVSLCVGGWGWGQCRLGEGPWQLPSRWHLGEGNVCQWGAGLAAHLFVAGGR